MSWVDAVQSYALPVVVAAAGYVSYEARRYFESRRRQLRLVMALRAELFIAKQKHHAMFASDKTEQIIEALVANVMSAKEGEHSMPSGAVIRGNPIFDHIKPELSDLPEEVIAPVIAYYQEAEGVAETLAAMYEGRYEGMPKERRVKTVHAFFEIGKSTSFAADAAFTSVDDYLVGKGKHLRLSVSDQKISDTQSATNAKSDDDDRGAA